MCGLILTLSLLFVQNKNDLLYIHAF